MKNMSDAGRSMVEMLGVLAVIGVISATALVGYSKAMQKNKVNKTEDEVVQIITNLRTLFASSANEFILGQPELETAIKAKVFPEHMVVSLTKLQNAYKGDVRLSVVEVDGKPTFKLTYEGLPKDAALSMATSYWGGEPEGMVQVVINEQNYE